MAACSHLEGSSSYKCLKFPVGRYLSQFLTHQFSPAFFFHLPFPFNLCSDSLSKICHKCPSRKEITAQQGTENEHFSLPWRIQGHHYGLLSHALWPWGSGKIESLFLYSTPCRKYNINYQFGGNVNWDEMAGNGGQIWKWGKNYQKLQTEIVLKNAVPKYKKGELCWF